MVELRRHVGVEGGVEDSLPAALLVVHGGRTDEVVRVSPGDDGVVSDTAHHNNCWALIAQYLDLGKCCLVWAGVLSLQHPCSSPLHGVTKPALRDRLLNNPNKRPRSLSLRLQDWGG